MQHKFLSRGKRLDNGKWVYGYFVESEHDLYNAYIITSAFWETDVDGGTDMISTEMYTVDPNTVGRYIGLTDKNGVKIFEGDIVKLSYVDENDDELTGDWFAVVEFGNPNGKYNWGFQLRPISECRWNCEILLWVDMEETGAYCEVIGNRFDNPELLGGSDGTIDT